MFRKGAKPSRKKIFLRAFVSGNNLFRQSILVSITVQYSISFIAVLRSDEFLVDIFSKTLYVN